MAQNRDRGARVGFGPTLAPMSAMAKWTMLGALALGLSMVACAAPSEDVEGSESAVSSGRTLQSAAWVYQPTELPGASEAILTDANLDQVAAIAARAGTPNADEVRAGRDPLREASGSLYPLARAYRAALTDLIVTMNKSGGAAADAAPRCSLGSAADRDGRSDRVATAAVVCRREVQFAE